MKNIKTFFVAVAAASLLSGCGAKASWEQVSYKRILNNSERISLVAKVTSATIEKLSNYEKKASYDYKTALQEAHSEEKQTGEFFSNGEAYSEDSLKEKYKMAGQTFEREVKETRAVARYDTEKYADFKENSETGFDYNEYGIPEGYESFAVKEGLDDVFNLLSNPQYLAVENKKGQQFFVYSQENEQYAPEAAGHEKRIYHEIHREQGLVYLNKDFTIKSVTYYEITQTNVDPDTMDLTKKAKTVEEIKESHTFKYGNRGDGSKKLSSYRDTAKNSFFLLNGYTFGAKLLKQDATELGDLGFNKVNERRLSLSKKHFIYRANHAPATVGDDPVNSIKLTLKGKTQNNTVTDPVDFDVEILVGSIAAGSTGMSVENGKLKMGKADTIITLEFDLEATSSGVNISNVAAYAEAYL
jgi:hypothetical protein